MAKTNLICENCGNPAIENDGDPFVNYKRKAYCLDCGLKLGMCAPMHYLDMCGTGDMYHHAEYHDGKIIAYQKWGKGYRKDELEILG